jgi:hypothetical protein
MEDNRMTQEHPAESYYDKVYTDAQTKTEGARGITIADAALNRMSCLSGRAISLVNTIHERLSVVMFPPTPEPESDNQNEKQQNIPEFFASMRNEMDRIEMAIEQIERMIGRLAF